MEIVDVNQQVIAQYRASGSGKATVAFYYGYGGPAAYRKANLLALQEAMRDIRVKMEPDLARLNNDLLSAEPVNIVMEAVDEGRPRFAHCLMLPAFCLFN